MHASDSDPANSLRTLLAQGGYQDVLDRYAILAAGGAPHEPAIAISVAIAATRLGHLDEGESLATEAQSGFRRRADDDGRLRALNLLGAIAYERGDLERAVERWTGALELARALGDGLFVARAANNLAITHHLSARVDIARSLYREAMLAYQRLADRRGLAESNHNLAITCRVDGQTALAANLNIEAVRHAEAVGDPVLLALMLVGRAETHLEQSEDALAEDGLNRAERLCQTANDELDLAEVARVRAELELKRDRPAAALDRAERGRSIAERHGSRLLQGECAAAASQAMNRLGRADEASRYRSEAEGLFRRLGATLYLERLPAA